MKKISIFLSLILLISFLPSVSLFNDTAQGAAIEDDNTPKLTFNVLSDTHIRESSFSTNKFLAALQDMHEVTPQSDALIINGDMTNRGYPEEYAKLRNLLEQSPISEDNVFFSIGNHEFHNEEGNEINIERFKEFVNEKEVYFEKRLKGYSFIFLGSESWGPVDSPTKDAAVLSDKQLKWLKSTLQKRSKENKPIFVYLHQPLPDTFGEGPMLIQHKELEEILSKYPQVILFSGHTHQDMRKPHSNMTDKKGFPVINTATTYYTTFWPDQNWDESQGLYVEVYEDKVEIKGRDFHRKQWIPETYYTIDFSSASTLAFGDQYLFPGETNIMSSTFTNYGKKLIKDIDVQLDVPEGWTIKPISNPNVSKLKSGESLKIEWEVTVPDHHDPGFVELDARVAYKFTGKEHTLKAKHLARVVPAVPSSDHFLSDMEWADATNHWGPVERDQSVGGQGLNDGETLAINGIKYEKGLGVHALSDVIYYLGGKFSTFTADVGIHDGVGNRGSVVFQVWADGEKVYDSGVVTGSDPAKSVQVDITGVNQLRLYVTDANDGRQYDHANWANAAVTNPIPAENNFLSDVDWVSYVNHWGPVEKDQSVGEKELNDGNKISIGGVEYEKGLGVHAYSEITYNLGGNFSRFVSDVGIDDEVGNNGSVTFEVWADGEKVYDSGMITGVDSAKSVDIDISGVKILKLVVTDGGDNTRHDHADWANAYIFQ